MLAQFNDSTIKCDINISIQQFSFISYTSYLLDQLAFASFIFIINITPNSSITISQPIQQNQLQHLHPPLCFLQNIYFSLSNNPHLLLAKSPAFLLNPITKPNQFILNQLLNHQPPQFIKEMYNLQMATKIKKQLQKQRISHVKQRRYLEKYSQSVQPQLLDNYNKRINTFLRKMQEHPVIMTQFDETEFAPHKMFRNFTNQKDKCIGPQKFKFKDHTDWNSIYTEAERTQRKMNEQVMEDKYGDKSLAYRSIASNSEYNSIARHQFRVRSKEKEINPPMKYVCAVPKIMIRKLKSKLNTSKVKTQPEDQSMSLKEKQSKLSNKNKALQSKNSFNFDEDNRSVRSFRSMRSIQDSVNNESTVNMQEDDQAKEKEKKMYMSPKVHFKTLVEVFEKCTDEKSKESMKDVLVKCRVFRVKDRKVADEIEVDKLAMEVEDTGNSKTFNNGKILISTK